MIRLIAFAVLLAVSACNGIDTGLNPQPDVAKERGPLTLPPAGVMRGAADVGAASVRRPDLTRR